MCSLHWRVLAPPGTVSLKKTEPPSFCQGEKGWDFALPSSLYAGILSGVHLCVADLHFVSTVADSYVQLPCSVLKKFPCHLLPLAPAIFLLTLPQ